MKCLAQQAATSQSIISYTYFIYVIIFNEEETKEIILRFFWLTYVVTYTSKQNI